MSHAGLMPFEDARTKLLSLAKPLGLERVDLLDADRRILGEDVVSPFPLPAFDHSSMDGYAVSSAHLTGNGPFELALSGESAARAGEAPPPVRPGTTGRIFTGARLPEGADAVVIQEDVEKLDGGRIRFTTRPEPGAWVRKQGDDLAAGAVAVARGTRLGPGKIALAAALDRPTILVHRRPVVAIVGSGDELRAPGSPGLAGSVAESNGYFIALAARRAGAVTRLLPFMKDDPDHARETLTDALRAADLVVTIGGVSVGDHDVVRPALEAAGVTIDFYRVAMKPGKPLVVGRRADTFVLGLPGNPASASLTFLLFGVPLLAALQGASDVIPTPVERPIVGNYARKPGRTEFVRAKLEAGRARLLPNQASGAVTSFAEAEALVVVPAERGSLRDGEHLPVHEIDALFP